MQKNLFHLLFSGKKPNTIPVYADYRSKRKKVQAVRMLNWLVLCLTVILTNCGYSLLLANDSKSTSNLLPASEQKYSDNLSKCSGLNTNSGQRALDFLVKNKEKTFFVSTAGNDQWSGRMAEPSSDGADGPFRTLEKAKMAVRKFRNETKNQNKTIVVTVRGGKYELDQTLTFTQEDSGSQQAPVIWQAARGELVQLVGGTGIAKIKKVESESVLKRLRPEVRDKIVQADLKAAGFEKFGSPDGNGIEPYFDNKPMQIARYPNSGFMTITGLGKDNVTPIVSHGIKGIKEGIFQTDDKRILDWLQEKDVWVHGYWFWDWAESRQKIQSIDPKTLTIKTMPPAHTYGYRARQWFYAFNLLPELDAPGEYYIDRKNALLYFYPPDKIKRDSLTVSRLNDIVVMKEVSNLIFAGFLLEVAQGSGIRIIAGADNLIAGCTVRNVNSTAIAVAGNRHTVFGCHLYQLGSAGIGIAGGNRSTLEPGYCAAVNNDIHDYALVQRVYRPGISTSGVGNRIANNRVTDAPHMAMGFSGNEHVIEYNEISNVCFESNDAGAIYTGHNWTMRGNVLQYNYLHDISGFRGKGCVGIYLDDMFSSADLIGNIFVNVTRAAMIGGGRDCSIVNNIFVNCKPALHVDARALGWCYKHADGWIQEAKEKGTISGIKWNLPPYSTRYPELANILDKQPKAPEGNIIERNIAVGGSWDSNKAGQWQGNSIEAKARTFLKMKNNFVNGDPMFQDSKKGDYRLKPESPALKMGFQQIPIEKIGLFEHPYAVKRDK